MYDNLASIFHDLWVPAIPIAEKILRPILVYIFLIIGIRMAGKRTLASLNAFDLVVLLSISNTVQNAIIGEDSSVSGGIIGASTLLIMNYLVVRFFFKHRRLDRLVEGKAVCLIRDGKILKANCDRELITEHELMIAAHRQGYHSLADISRAELEPNSGITFLSKTPTAEESRDIVLHKKIDAITEQVSQLLQRIPPDSASAHG
jgi:uncharacterized membrane protein YcaP (DUF421 family)